MTRRPAKITSFIELRPPDNRAYLPFPGATRAFAGEVAVNSLRRERDALQKVVDEFCEESDSRGSEGKYAGFTSRTACTRRYGADTEDTVATRSYAAKLSSWNVVQKT